MNLSMQSTRKSQRGFTLIEVLIVLAIIGVLVVTLTQGITGNVDESKFKRAELFFTSSLPQKMITLFGRRGTINGVSAARLKQTGLVADSAWGDAWTMPNTCANKQCVIVYPVGGTDAGKTDLNGTELASLLTSTNASSQKKYSHIVSAVYDSNSNNLTVTVRVR